MGDADDHEVGLESLPDSMPKVIEFLSSVLERVAKSNDMMMMKRRRLDESTEAENKQKLMMTWSTSVFDCLTTPSISIQSYLQRIVKYADCSPSCFVVAYVYLDRFTHRQPSLPINSFNVHRLLITSVLLSAKFMDDIYYNNAYYARVGGISTAEMNLLEVDFLFGLGFQLNVTPATFHTYYSYLQREMLLHSLPPHLPESPANLARRLKLLCSFNEDDSTHQTQLAV